MQIAGDATQEGIDAGDIDGDGRVDVAGSAHLDPRAPGTEVVWWRNPGIGAGSWTRHAVGTTAVEIDRLRLADINGDGRLDIVVTDTEYRRGFGNLYWFEHLRGGGWLRHLIAGNLGALHSLDVGDLNGDGQVDLVVGEHRGHGLRTIIWENVGRSVTWRARVIDAGKESHLGTRLADLSGHGPLDIVSIAFDTSQSVNPGVLSGGDTIPVDDFFGARRSVPPTAGAVERPSRLVPMSHRSARSVRKGCIGEVDILTT